MKILGKKPNTLNSSSSNQSFNQKLETDEAFIWKEGTWGIEDFDQLFQSAKAEIQRW